MPPTFKLLCLLLGLGLFSSQPALAEESVSFHQEVMPVLSRAGCNQGTCHGNLNGKGGFKLSLRGQDPDLDYAVLTREQMGRRLNRLLPQESLLLQKATTRVPHEGGQRFTTDSSEYNLLFRWIAQGASLPTEEKPKLQKLLVEPVEVFLLEPTQEIKVQAWGVFADGSKKDLGELAVFESSNPRVEVSRHGLVTSASHAQTTITVRYLHLQGSSQLAFVAARPDFRWQAPPINNYIDQLVYACLQKLRMNPSALCTDSEFLRRAYLDLLGMLPSPEETRRFLASNEVDKRSRLVEALLARPEFAEYWAVKWSDVLRNEEKLLDRKGVKIFYEWIRKSLADNKPLNQFARELLTATGSTYTQPAANYYRVLRDPQNRAEATAQVFLGIRMQCAKCHNHPFNQWTQNDYHQLAAFFPRIQYRIVGNDRKDKLDKHEFVGEQVVYLDDSSEVNHPSTGNILTPRFLGGPTLKLGPKDDRLLPLADWVADPNNPFFARTQANRIWSYLMGRGIVDPNDDFRQSNPPVNGPLLEALAKDLVAHHFDQKYLIRTIMNSRIYQLSSQPNDTNADDELNFSRNEIRSLAAEPLLDALAQVTGTKLTFPEYPEAQRAGQVPSMPVIRRGESFKGNFRFLKTFGKPERLLNCDCERSDATTLAQALQLITGEVVNKAIAEPDNRLGKMLQAGKANDEILEELFLASLCRLPGNPERTALLERIERAANRRETLEDVLWGLLNSKEFLLRK
jgi:hypothetical protein